jgi:hypothetical protein
MRGVRHGQPWAAEPAIGPAAIAAPNPNPNSNPHPPREWMGHANLKTTLRYMHYAPRADDAARLSAFIAAQTEPNVVPLDAAAA